MSLHAKIKNDLKESMKARNTSLTNYLKVVIGELDRIGKDVPDDKVIARLKSMNEDAMSMFNEFESMTLAKYLPKMMTTDEINAAVKSIVEDNELTSMKDMGTAMKLIKEQYGQTIDNSIASKKVRELLNS